MEIPDYLCRIVRLKGAFDLMLTNARSTARQAKAMGVIVPPDAELQAEAEALAGELARGRRKRATGAYGGGKRLLYASSNNPLFEQKNLEVEVIADLSMTAEARQGSRDFSASARPSSTANEGRSD